MSEHTRIRCKRSGRIVTEVCEREQGLASCVEHCANNSFVVDGKLHIPHTVRTNEEWSVGVVQVEGGEWYSWGGERETFGPFAAEAEARAAIPR